MIHTDRSASCRVLLVGVSSSVVRLVSKSAQESLCVTLVGSAITPCQRSEFVTYRLLHCNRHFEFFQKSPKYCGFCEHFSKRNS